MSYPPTPRPHLTKSCPPVIALLLNHPWISLGRSHFCYFDFSLVKLERLHLVNGSNTCFNNLLFGAFQPSSVQQPWTPLRPPTDKLYRPQICFAPAMFLPPLQASSPMAWRPRGASMCRQNILIPTREIDWNRCPCPVDGCVLGSAEMKCEGKHTACDSCLYDNDVLIDTSPWWFTIYLCFIWHQSIRAWRMWVHRMIYRRQKDECERYSQGQEKEKERCWCHKRLS